MLILVVAVQPCFTVLLCVIKYIWAIWQKKTNSVFGSSFLLKQFFSLIVSVKVFIYPGYLEVEQIELWQLDLRRKIQDHRNKSSCPNLLYLSLIVFKGEYLKWQPLRPKSKRHQVSSGPNVSTLHHCLGKALVFWPDCIQEAFGDLFEAASLYWIRFVSAVHVLMLPTSPADRSLRQLWGERCGRGHRLHGHGPGLPRWLFRLHDLQHQAARQALLCRGEEGLLWALLHCEFLFTSCFCLILPIYLWPPNSYIFYNWRFRDKVVTGPLS